MVNDDVLYGFRLRLFSLAAERGNVREACRIFGVYRPPTTAGGSRSCAAGSKFSGRASGDHRDAQPDEPAACAGSPPGGPGRCRRR